MEKDQPLLIVIAGPTAVGKTSVSIELAKYFNTSVLSADSRQCYREMKIGTARPSTEEQEGIPHYFIASHSIHQALTAVDYEQYALKVLEEEFKKKNTVIVCGGTGLYLKALLEGFDTMPPIDINIQEEVFKNYESYGLEWLQKALSSADPLYVSEGYAMDNPNRMMRALIFAQSHQESIIKYQKGKKKTRSFDVVLIGLNRSRAELYDRINQRVDKMMEEGLLKEVNDLLPYHHLKNLDTVGYRELFNFLKGASSLEDAVAKIKQNSRRYAKRQITWFKRMEGMTWFEPSEIPAIIDHILSYQELK